VPLGASTIRRIALLATAWGTRPSLLVGAGIPAAPVLVLAPSPFRSPDISVAT